MKGSISSALQSISTKIILILLAMAATTASALWLSNQLVRTFSTEIEDLSARDVPAILGGVAMLSVFSGIRAELTDYSLSATPEELREHNGNFGVLMDGAQKELSQSSPEALRLLKPLLDQMPDQMAIPITSRLAQFDQEEVVAQKVADLTRIRTEIEAEMVSELLGPQSPIQLFLTGSTAAVGTGPALMPGEGQTPQVAASDPAAVSDPGSSQLADFQKRLDLYQALQKLVGTAQDIALTETAEDLATVADRLSGQRAEVQAILAQRSISPTPAIQLLLDITTDVAGIVDAQHALLTARAATAERFWQVEEFVSSAFDTALSLAQAELGQIQITSDELLATAAWADSMNAVLDLTSLFILLFAPVAAYVMIARPLRATTEATTRLADGDLTAIGGLKATKGELGAMASALRVFRDSLVEKARLEVEERENQAQRLQQERAAIEEQAAQAKREAALEAEREQRQRDLEAAEAARRDEIRRAAEAERMARDAVQSLVVTELANGLRRLAEGQLTARIETEFGDGYDQLRSDFNAALATLEQVIGTIRGSITSIHGGSDEISRAAEDLSRRTEQTAAMLEQSAAALTQLTASVESAADGAAEASRIVSNARASAEANGAVVNEAVHTMGAIEESSRKISTFVNVIDDIAFQTNLLALNAGVEAARAGEAGRGFAVVASEVRALSQRSSEAAREIADLISESGRQVNRGVNLVGKTGDALTDIVKSVIEISGHVGTIAASAREQSTGISEINVAIGQLDQSTQQNAAMVEETTAASIALADEASQLSRTVAHFVVADTDRSHASHGEDSWRNRTSTSAAA